MCLQFNQKRKTSEGCIIKSRGSNEVISPFGDSLEFRIAILRISGLNGSYSNTKRKFRSSELGFRVYYEVWKFWLQFATRIRSPGGYVGFAKVKRNQLLICWKGFTVFVSVIFEVK